jgi:hypothetical protein
VSETTHSLVRNPACACCDLGDELMIHDMVSGDVHVLNPTARFIWDNCHSQSSAEDLADGLTAKFSGVDYQCALSDVITALEEFSRMGLFTDDGSFIGTEQNGDKQ